MASADFPLITAEELKTRLVDPPAKFVLIDARASRSDSQIAHLPRAIYADLERDLSQAGEATHDPVRGGRHPLPDLKIWTECLGGWGITPDTSVVVYDDMNGANAAARFWWMLRSIGHTDVRVLDGGMNAAIQSGINAEADLSVDAKPGTTGNGGSRPAYPAKAWQWPTVDIVEVARRSTDPNFVTIDVRSRERWAGKVEPIDPVAGHIPETTNLPFGENLTASGKFKSAADLRVLYKKILGGVALDHVAVHCGSGVTACHTLLALELAGMPGAQLYVGSYSEWCRSGRPIGNEEAV